MPEITSSSVVLTLWVTIGYVLGSVPFGLVISRMLRLGDLRQIGSGNIGATNVLRTGNRAAALATLFLDSGKGAITVLLARALANQDAAIVAGAAAFLGHCFPIWLGFRGGKGVATFLGTLLALHWPLGLAACAIWALTAAVSRISSLSALVAAAMSVPVAWVSGGGDLIAACLFMAALIFVRHRANIARIASGQEPRIGGRT